METIKLILPSEEYLDQVRTYRQECFDADSSMDGCGPLRNTEDPVEWLADVRAYTDPATLPEGKVLALLFCKETLGLDRVLITCNTSNEGSRRTILSAGGVYENTVHEPDRNVDLERYWIALVPFS